MAGVDVHGVEGMKEIVGEEIGPGEARAVTQELIDGFAEVSGDHQWIHVDPERSAKESPYGKTIAHGNLTLSLADSFRKELVRADGFALGVNYGWKESA
jgi:acyl dehydratase